MHRPVLRLSAVLACASAAALAAGCSALQSSERNLLGAITPYRIEVVQGNVVTREQAAQVRQGMTRAQVREVLGSPLLTDIFHADRWDYVFTIRRSGAEPQRRVVTAWFEGERLARVDAPELPSEQDFVASISRERNKPAKLPVLELTPEQRAALPAPKPETAITAAPAPEGPVRDYPPLER